MLINKTPLNGKTNVEEELAWESFKSYSQKWMKLSNSSKLNRTQLWYANTEFGKSVFCRDTGDLRLRKCFFAKMQTSLSSKYKMHAKELKENIRTLICFSLVPKSMIEYVVNIITEHRDHDQNSRCFIRWNRFGSDDDTQNQQRVCQSILSHDSVDVPAKNRQKVQRVLGMSRHEWKHKSTGRKERITKTATTK